MNEWVRLEDLPPGFVFVTQDGILAVKSEYHHSFSGHCMCVLLGSGEYAHFVDGDNTLVRAVEVQHSDNERELLEAVQWAYRKHHLGDMSIGWDELSEKLGDTLSNAMGVESFVKWQEEQAK